MVDNGGGINEQAGGSSAERATEATGNNTRQSRLPTDHFEKLLEETCPNQAYSIKHKLRDCGLMKNFMNTGSLRRGMEIDEAPTEGDASPFLGEDAVMTICGRHPSPEKHRGVDQGWRDAEM
jgi:hypothetical protein